jgi:hypothetical protein
MFKILDNSKPNQTTFQIGDVTVYFSYHTPIAFHYYDTGLVVNTEKYSVTSSKHLGQVKQQYDTFTGKAFPEFIDALQALVCLR